MVPSNPWGIISPLLFVDQHLILSYENGLISRMP